MRNLKVRFIDGDIIVEQDIDVDGAIVISGEWRAESGELATLCGMDLCLPEGALDHLGSFQELTGGEGSLYEDDTIEKAVLGLEAPGFGLDKC